MSRRSRLLFLALVGVQAAHAVEEYRTALWEVWPLARAVSAIVSAHPPTGFAIVNAAFVLFGLVCAALPRRPGWPSARPWAWVWVAVGIANGVFHPLGAFAAGGYFPGVVTAPLLLVLALVLAADLRRAPASATRSG